MKFEKKEVDDEESNVIVAALVSIRTSSALAYIE